MVEPQAGDLEISNPISTPPFPEGGEGEGSVHTADPMPSLGGKLSLQCFRAFLKFPSCAPYQRSLMAF